MTQATSRAVGPEQVRAVSPALEAHTQERVVRTLWHRTGLTKRDRALVTLATLIAGGQAGPLGTYTAKALDHGVAPSEISEVVLHLAYYAGWAPAIAATKPIAAVFTERGIGEGLLPAVEPDPLPLDDRPRRVDVTASARSSERPRQVWSIIRPTTCSAIYGSGPT